MSVTRGVEWLTRRFALGEILSCLSSIVSSFPYAFLALPGPLRLPSCMKPQHGLCFDFIPQFAQPCEASLFETGGVSTVHTKILEGGVWGAL